MIEQDGKRLTAGEHSQKYPLEVCVVLMIVGVVIMIVSMDALAPHIVYTPLVLTNQSLLLSATSISPKYFEGPELGQEPELGLGPDKLGTAYPTKSCGNTGL